MTFSEESNEIFRFVVRALIRSQIELKKEQDEEVNVYLAHLLLLLTNPQYQKWASNYVKENDLSVYQQVEINPNRVDKYFTYKLNADYLLTSLGIFQNLGKPHGVIRRFYETTPRTYMGWGKTYYDWAAEYHRQIYRHNTSIEDILHKLASSFEEYVRVLSHIRSTYFDFVARISETDLIQFKKQLESLEGKGPF